jgi:hypothetical protein
MGFLFPSWTVFHLSQQRRSTTDGYVVVQAGRDISGSSV